MCVLVVKASTVFDAPHHTHALGPLFVQQLIPKGRASWTALQQMRQERRVSMPLSQAISKSSGMWTIVELKMSSFWRGHVFRQSSWWHIVVRRSHKEKPICVQDFQHKFVQQFKNIMPLKMRQQGIFIKCTADHIASSHYTTYAYRCQSRPNSHPWSLSLNDGLGAFLPMQTSSLRSFRLEILDRHRPQLSVTKRFRLLEIMASTWSITTLCPFQSPQWSSSWPLPAAAPTHTEQPSIWRMRTQPLFVSALWCFWKWSLSTNRRFDSTDLKTCRSNGQTLLIYEGWRHTKRFVNPCTWKVGTDDQPIVSLPKLQADTEFNRSTFSPDSVTILTVYYWWTAMLNIGDSNQKRFAVKSEHLQVQS